MLTVSPEKDGKTVKEYYKKAGFSSNENSHAVTARQGEEILGYCIFDIKDETATVYDLEPKDDILLADGVLRCALHVAAERFIFKADYKNEKLKDLLKSLAFIKDEAANTLDMDKLFGGCSCGKEK